MVPSDGAIILSYKLSIVIIALPLTIQLQFAIECLQRSNQQGWVTLGQNLGRKKFADVSQILTRSGRHMGLSYAKIVDIFCRLSTVHEGDRQTDLETPWNGNIAGKIACQQFRLIINFETDHRLMVSAKAVRNQMVPSRAE